MGDELKEVEERCSPMPVTLISAAGHAALFHYCATILVPAEENRRLVGRGPTQRLVRASKRERRTRIAGWRIGTEVVDASGQTHLPLKQLRRNTRVPRERRSCSDKRLSGQQQRGACEFERKKAIWPDRFAWTRVHRRFMSFPETSVARC